jgi:hypothetical protein
LGVNQTWQNVSGSRVSGTTYTNSTGKPIAIAISQSLSGGTLTVGGLVVAYAAGGQVQPWFAIVPDGVTYVASLTRFSTYWQELR